MSKGRLSKEEVPVVYKAGEAQYAVRQDGETIFTSRDRNEVEEYAAKMPRAESAKRTARADGWSEWTPLPRPV